MREGAGAGEKCAHLMHGRSCTTVETLPSVQCQGGARRVFTNQAGRHRSGERRKKYVYLRILFGVCRVKRCEEMKTEQLRKWGTGRGVESRAGWSGFSRRVAWPGLAWLGLAWLGLAWLGLAWLG